MLKRFLLLSAVAVFSVQENQAMDSVYQRIHMDNTYESPFLPVAKQVAVIDSGYARDNDALRGYLDIDHGFYARQNQLQNSMTRSAVLAESIIQRPNDPNHNKSSSHGSHVAGLAAQAFGDISHVTHDGTFKPVVPVKISTNHTETQNFIDALVYLKDNNNVAVINLSWRLNFHHKAIESDLEQAMLDVMAAGKIIVLSAGNDSLFYGTTEYTKSIMNLAEKSGGRLLIVGASDLKDGKEQMASFSNLSNNISAPYFVTAPGHKLKSFVPLSINADGQAEKSGTSMAAPIVAGVLTRLITDFPQLTVDEISQIFRDTARRQYRDNGQVYNRFGCGIIDVDAAREMATLKVTEKIMPQEVQSIPQPEPVMEQPEIEVLQPKVQDPVQSTGWMKKAWNVVSNVGAALKETVLSAVKYVDTSRVGYALRSWWYS